MSLKDPDAKEKVRRPFRIWYYSPLLRLEIAISETKCKKKTPVMVSFGMRLEFDFESIPIDINPLGT